MTFRYRGEPCGRSNWGMGAIGLEDAVASVATVGNSRGTSRRAGRPPCTTTTGRLRPGPNLPAPAVRPTTPHPERPLPFRPFKRLPSCCCHEVVRGRSTKAVDYPVHRLRDLVRRVSGEIFGNGIGVQAAARPARPSCVTFRGMEQLIRKGHGRFHTISMTERSELNNRRSPVAQGGPPFFRTVYLGKPVHLNTLDP